MKKVICPNCKNKIKYNLSIPEDCPYCLFNIDPMRTLDYEYSESFKNDIKYDHSRIHGIGQGDKIILKGNEYSIVQILSENDCEATIYKVEDANKKALALKIFLEFYNQIEEPNHEVLKRVRSITSPNILKLHDFGVGSEKYQGKYCWEIFDYIEGGDLLSVSDFKAKYTKEFLEKNIVPQILHGISKLHELKIYHCDLKPSNIFYKDTNQTDLLIGDYDSAKAYDFLSLSETVITDMWKGTRAYFAPEQADGFIGEKNDYYSFGMILAHLLYPDQLCNENNYKQIELSKFKIVRKRQFNGMDMLNFNPEYTELNNLISRLTLYNVDNRWGQIEVEKWLYDQEKEY